MTRTDLQVARGRGTTAGARLARLALGMALAALALGAPTGGTAGPDATVLSLSPSDTGPAPVPPARYHAAMVWDSTNDRALVFGGTDRDHHNSLLAYDPETERWSRISAKNPPPSRVSPTAVWDPVREQMIVFSGLGPEPGDSLSNDVFVYDPGENRWSHPTSIGNAPSPRDMSAAVWDTANDRMLVFGGSDGGFHDNVNDLWSYDPADGTWTELRPQGPAPGPRHDHIAVWDPVRERMIVYGGWKVGAPGDPPRVRDDLWAYDPAANRWQELEPKGDPAPRRSRHVAVWDADQERMLVFAGCCGTERWNNDLWAYDPASNRGELLETSDERPPIRQRHAAAWDPQRNELLAFGGIGDCFLLNDLWAYGTDDERWRRIEPAASLAPPQREGHTAAWDARNQRILSYGGCTGSSPTNDLFALDADGGWTELSTDGPEPSGHVRHQGVTDPQTGDLYVFGGFTDEPNLWRYDAQAGRWAERGTRGPRPDVRFDHTMVWDTERDRIWLHAGEDPRGRFRDDLWSYDPADDRWRRVEADGGPGRIAMHEAVWDARGDRMLVFGGWKLPYAGGPKQELTDLWAFHPSEGRWERLPTPKGPPSVFKFSLVLDPERNQLLLFGGFKFQVRRSNEPYVSDQLWRYDLDLQLWEQVEPSGPRPSARFAHGATWNPMTQEMVIVGGYADGHLDDVWAYDPQTERWTERTP